MADQEDKDQKTEEATPRRVDEARDKGQVAMSTELIAAVGLCAGMATLAFAGGPLAQSVGGLISGTMQSLPSLGTMELSPADSAGIIEAAVMAVFVSLALVMLPALLTSALAGYAQVGFRVTPKAIELDPSKVSPIKGFERLFSLRGVVRTALAAAKVIAIAITMCTIAWFHVDEVVRLGDSELGPLLVGLGHIGLRCALGALLTILALSLIDLLFQRFQHRRDLRMSKKEVREEQRLTDGDPHVKARVRQLQREMATRRMMDDVPSATVVVTNPTHYAIALKYDREDEAHAAPVCVAKGVDSLAERIKAVAAANDVVCYEDVPLARALHAQVEVGREIPEALYAAVATVLGYVLRMKGVVAAGA